MKKKISFLFILCFLGSCHQKSLLKDQTQLRISFKKKSIEKIIDDKKANKSFSFVPEISFGLQKPTNHTEVHCFGVLVFRPPSPEDVTSVGTCTGVHPTQALPSEEVQVTSLTPQLVPTNGIAEITVLSGPNQIIRVVGVKKAATRTCESLNLAELSFDNRVNMSAPYILGKLENVLLEPGPQELQVRLSLNNNNLVLDDCKNAEFNWNQTALAPDFDIVGVKRDVDSEHSLILKGDDGTYGSLEFSWQVNTSGSSIDHFELQVLDETGVSSVCPVRNISDPQLDTFTYSSSECMLQASTTYLIELKAYDAAGDFHVETESLRVAPKITGMTLVPNTGTLNVGGTADFTLTFSEPVVVQGDPKLKTTATNGGTHLEAGLFSGSTTATLTYRYTAAAGDTTSSNPFTHFDENALKFLAGDRIHSQSHSEADVNPALPSPSSLGSSLTVGVIPPTISSVSIAPNTGGLLLGEIVTFDVFFSEAVVVDTVGGTPVIKMTATNSSNPLNATFVSGSGTTNLSFTYTIQSGDTLNGATLTYFDGSALTLEGGTIESQSNPGTSAVLNLPPNTSPGNTSTIAPHVISMSMTPNTGALKSGDTATFTLNFNEPVTVTGTPKLELTDTFFAFYSTGTGTTALNFVYTVAAGHVSTENLATLNTTALQLNGGTIKGQGATQANADLATPAPSTLGSSVTIDAIQPSMTALSVSHLNCEGTAPNFFCNEGDKIKFDITFDENITIQSGDNPFLELNFNSRKADLSNSPDGSGSVVSFEYIIQAGDSTSGGPVDYVDAIQDSHELVDSVGNQVNPDLSGFPAPTDNYVVDTSAPAAFTITGVKGPGTDPNVDDTVADSFLATNDFIPKVVWTASSDDQNLTNYFVEIVEADDTAVTGCNPFPVAAPATEHDFTSCNLEPANNNEQRSYKVEVKAVDAAGNFTYATYTPDATSFMAFEVTPWAPLNINTTNCTAAAFPARSHHSAVWGNDKLIIFGGEIDASPLTVTNTGALIDPVTGTCDLLPTSNAPSARRDHVAFFDPTGNKMFIIGGVDANGAAVSDMAIYDKVGDTWETHSFLNIPNIHGERPSVFFDGQKIFVFGGKSTHSTPYSEEMSVLDLAGGPPSWFTATKSPPPPAGRAGAAVGFKSPDRLAIYGGEDGTGPLGGGVYFNLANNQWTTDPVPTAPAPDDRAFFTWHPIQNPGPGFIIFGGKDGVPNELNDVSLLVNGTWDTAAVTGTPPTARVNASSAIDPTASLLFIQGGVASGSVEHTAALFNFQSANRLWQPFYTSDKLPAKRKFHTVTGTPHGWVVWGGDDPSNNYLDDGARLSP